MDAQEALKLFTETRDYWSEIYAAHKEDVRFSIGLDHYTDAEIKARGANGCMIVPVLPQYIHQVMNDERMNTPSINVLPGEGEGADIETAKIFKGLIRQIEYKSKADAVYDTGGEYAVRGGFGFIAIDHDYVSDDSFLQELKLRRVQNPESVYIDKNSIEIDGSDAEIGFYLDPISKSDFEEKYPGKAFVSFDDKNTDSKAETINLCQVFVKKYETIKKQLSAAGEIEDYVEADEETEKKKTKRTLRKVKICRYKFSGQDLLEETTFPGKFIPIVPVYGEEVWVDGKRHLLSLIRLAKDAQRRVNKWASKESEILDMAPIAPVQAPLGAVDDFMDEWGSPGDVNVMRYKMFDEQGRPLNKPERLAPPPIPTGIINAMQGAKESVKEALGLYNASLGARSNETSGVAIDARKVEGEVATFHFADNRNKSIEQVGRILVSAIPEVYDTDRIIQIIGEEENPIKVGINGAPPQEGQKQPYDLRKGQYDVRVTTGASYTTKRQEAAAVFGDVLKNNPQLIQVLGDLWAKNLDVAGAESMAARLHKMVPKELLADEEADEDKPAIDPEKEEMAQVIEGLQGQLQQAVAAIEDKSADSQIKQVELQIKSKELDVKGMEAEAKLIEAQTKAQQPTGQGQTIYEDTVKERELQLKETQVLFDQAIKKAEFDLKAQMAQFEVLAKLNESEQPLISSPNEVEPSEPKPEDLERKVEEQEKKLMLAQVLETISGLRESINAQTQVMQKPMQVIRDENGAIVGAQ
jgi:hypothetical protein